MPDSPQAQQQPSQARPSVTLVLPAYNEAERIGSALNELFGYLKRSGPPREGARSASELGPIDILVVDDGSTDSTAEIVAARPEAQLGASPQLRLIRRAHEGKGAAVKAGHSYTTPSILVLPIEGGDPGYLRWIFAETEESANSE